MFVPQIRAHADALADLADRLGPDAPVPTCPEWTVGALLTHLAGVTGFFDACCRTPASSGPPEFPTAPEAWPDARSWWDERRAGLVELLDTTDLATPAWAPRGFAPELRSWARRAAHEFAVHRLDLEHAAAGSTEAGAVPSLFEPAFAVDGVDELLTRLTPPADTSGSVLYRADDVGTGWVLRLEPGAAPTVTTVTAGTDTRADATVTGSADAVYRAAWHRPHTAEVSGATDVLEAVRTP